MRFGAQSWADSHAEEIVQTDRLVGFCLLIRREATIEKCILSVRDHVDEVIVEDTGSKDRTPEIARKLGARVYHCEWTDDFAAARRHVVTLEPRNTLWQCVIPGAATRRTEFLAYFPV